MLLSDPPRTPYDLNFRVVGIPVRVHPWFWLVTLLFGLGGNAKPAEMLIWMGAVFVSILVHELGHALVARAHGWDPSITLYGMGGLASYRPTYHTAASQMLITVAGPLAGFLFAVFIMAMVAASGHRVEINWNLPTLLPIAYEHYDAWQAQELIGDLLFINIFWGLINLLPVYPLDGGNLSREFLGLLNPSDGLRQSLWLSVICGAVVAVLAYTKLGSLYMTLFFGYLAYMSYTAVQQYSGFGGGPGGYR